jgi:predicted CXXCH cytochrome family protein
MRIRTAKQRAQRIDLNYFKQSRGLRRWRILLSIAVPIAALLWVVGLAAAGSRRAYSAGPVSSAHAFAEKRCEVCHARRASSTGFRVHTSDAACLSCHDAPAHYTRSGPMPPGMEAPACASCHQEHRGRVRLAQTDDRLCLDCHRGAHTSSSEPQAIAALSGSFPSGHPEFAVFRNKTMDPTGLHFSHAAHLKKEGVRGSRGIEQLQCVSCHRPEIDRTLGKRVIRTGLMAPVSYTTDCARCHPLFFDERIDDVVPHPRTDAAGEQLAVRTYMQRALTLYIHDHADEISKTDAAVRRVPLNFPRAIEPPARSADEWVARRLEADERIMWNKTCAECHQFDRTAQVYWRDNVKPFPLYLRSNVTRQWLTRASFDHTAHSMVKCDGCHAGGRSTSASDVLLPKQAVCATCHSTSKGAESRCFECHSYHDWSKAHQPSPRYGVTDFK